MRSLNYTILSFLLTLCLAGGGAATAQTLKRDREKTAKNAQSFDKTTSKTDAKTSNKKDVKTTTKTAKNAEAVAKNSKPKTETNDKPKSEPAAEKAPTEDEKASFETAQSLTNPFERIEKIKEFLTKYPRSSLKLRAQESLVASRAEYADELMRTGDPTGGKEQFRLALKDAPAQISDKLFADVVSRIPANLFFRGEQTAAFEIAKKVEQKAGDNPDRLIALAQFYLVIENSEDARRLALRASQLKPDSATPQITLGLANRIGFRLEAASQAFNRALEIDSKSVAAKRGLADALRGLGQTEDAAKLYREILGENAADEAARNGLVLALFGAGNRTEAETEMNRALEQNPKNYQLLATAAYWYAANKEAAKAVEIGQKAVDIEPRYTWAHIALARGLLNEGKPLEAERALLIAKQYGNFPTLNYELATARYAAGFYEEAAADLRKSFQIKNGVLETSLAGRIKQEAPNFIELLALERRASILQPTAADTDAQADQMKKLLVFADRLNSAKKDETEIAKAAQEFVAGNDAWSVHRKLYAANRLLKEQIALPQALEFAQSATDGVDAGVQIPAAAAAVMAEELYEPRQLAAAQGSLVTVPEIGRSVLTNIVRGRIEEIAGWSLYNQNRAEEAVVRLKRAVGILPEKSAWWRSSQWRLGAALEKAEKPREALEAYVKSYRSGAPDANRRAAIEALYVRVHGTNRNLDVKLGETVAQTSEPNPAFAAQASAPMKNPLPEVIAEINPPKTEINPQPQPKQSEPAKVETTPEMKSPEPKKNVAEPIKTEPETIVPQPEPIKTETQPTIEKTAEKTAEKTEVKTENAKVNGVAPVTEKTEAKAETAQTEEKSQPAMKVGKFDNAVPETSESPAIKTEEVKSEPVKEDVKSEPEKTEKAAEPKTETAPLRVLLVDNLKNTVTEVPGAKIEKTETDKTETVPSKTAPETNPNVKIVSTLELPIKIAEKPATRPRVACAIWLNQTEISVLSNGGMTSLIVGIEGDKPVSDLVATSENQTDIEVKLSKDVQISGNRALYEIRSISESKGDFTITFESSCGKKTVKVRVR